MKKLTYSDNEMGQATAEQISQILLWKENCLDELTLSNLKTTNYFMAVALSPLKMNKKLKKLNI